MFYSCRNGIGTRLRRCIRAETSFGVLIPLNHPIVEVDKSLSKLKQLGKRLGFVTNNSSFGIKKILSNFEQQGCQVDEEDVVFGTIAIVEYLRSINFDREIFLIANAVIREDFERAGFKIAERPSEKLTSFATILDCAKYKPNIGAVIVDVDMDLNFSTLFEAGGHLNRPDVLFIAGATEKNVWLSKEVVFMGPGYFTDLLSEYSRRKPMVFGKPGQYLQEYVVKKYKIKKPSRTIFVGDLLEHDMRFATSSGYQKLLVLTGHTKLEEALNETDKDCVPDFYVNSFGDLHRLIKEKLDI